MTNRFRAPILVCIICKCYTDFKFWETRTERLSCRIPYSFVVISEFFTVNLVPRMHSSCDLWGIDIPLSLSVLHTFLFLDDSMAILMAFREPSVEIIGLTTIFGNVSTEGATRNALLLVRIWDDWILFHYFLGFANCVEFYIDSVREQGILKFQ